MADELIQVKRPWQSRTVILNLVLAVSAFFVGGNAFVQAHLAEFGMGWGILNIILRSVTKDKISLGD